MKKIILLILVISVYSWAGSTRFTRNATTNVVRDNKMNLEWQDDYSDNSGNVKNISWESGVGYCDALSLDGGDWRLPNAKELFSILDYSASSPAISVVFQENMSGNYWSSTTDSGRKDYAYFINFSFGEVMTNAKSFSSYIRCVRCLP